MNIRFLYRAMKTRYRDQKCEVRALLNALRPDQIAVDVGANKGSYLYWLSRAVPRGEVVAFEPQPNLARYLQRITNEMRLENVTVEAAGVSDRSGALILNIPGHGDSPGASFEQAVRVREKCRALEVPVYSLDDYFRGRQAKVGALKIDVEGHELAVLRGAEQLIHDDSPLLVFECESRHMTEASVDTVLQFLLGKGYDGWFIHRSQLVPLSEFRPDMHQKANGERFWDSKDYCSNFIMRKV